MIVNLNVNSLREAEEKKREVEMTRLAMLGFHMRWKVPERKLENRELVNMSQTVGQALLSRHSKASFQRRTISIWGADFSFLILKFVPFNTTVGRYLRFQNREKMGGHRTWFFVYRSRHEGTTIFILARVGAENGLFGADRKIKSTFKRWIRLEYTLKSIQ